MIFESFYNNYLVSIICLRSPPQDSLDYQKSALSMYCFLEHSYDFGLKHFKISIVKRVRPVELDREEERLIQKFRTNICGLNRIVVVR